MNSIIATAQQLLNDLGYACGPVDGIAGPKTRRALRRFQLDYGLRPDAVAGAQTLALLERSALGTSDRRPGRSDSAPESAFEELDSAIVVRAVQARFGRTTAPILTRTAPLLLVGLRGWQRGRPVANRLDRWNDTILVVKEDEVVPFPASVDPGVLQQENPRGTAHLVEGVYSYRMGLHRRRERALVQAGVVRLRRYFDLRPGDLDAYEEEGWFGINIHRGGSGERVGSWSAGCQAVHGSRWAAFMEHVDEAFARGQHRFAYALLEGQWLDGFLAGLRERDAAHPPASSSSPPGSSSSSNPPPL